MATLIYDVNGLQDMELDLAGDYELANNIDASATSGWNGGLGFDPIGTFASPFTGSFDGKGFTISDLTINRPSEDYVGLFGRTEGVTIQNVTLSGGSIIGEDYTGALIGRLDEGYDVDYIPFTVYNCHATCDVTGEYNTGGLIGTITTSSSYTCLVSQCSATGDVTSVRTLQSSVGGLIGKTFFSGENLTISKCYATGDVELPNLKGDAGGLIGTCGSETVEDCYATGNVIAGTQSADDGAGLIGSGVIGILRRCFSIGTVQGLEEWGLYGGFAPDTDIDNFWDTETSGESASMAGLGRTTAQMKILATFAGWDIALYATMRNNGYPFLGWEVGDETHTWLIYGTLAPRQTVEVEDVITLKAIRNIEMGAHGRFYIDEEGNAVYKSRFGRMG